MVASDVKLRNEEAVFRRTLSYQYLNSIATNQLTTKTLIAHHIWFLTKAGNHNYKIKELFQMNCLNFLNLTDNICLNYFHTSVPQSLKKVVSIKPKKYIKSNHNPFANKNIQRTSLRNRSLKDHAPMSRVSYQNLKVTLFDQRLSPNFASNVKRI